MVYRVRGQGSAGQWSMGPGRLLGQWSMGSVRLLGQWSVWKIRGLQGQEVCSNSSQCLSGFPAGALVEARVGG